MDILKSLVLGGLLLGGSGCHKQVSAGTPPQTLDEGLAKLRAELVSANADVQSNFYHGVSYGVRYGNYPAAQAALQQIASDPSLTDEQKKTVSAVDDLLKAQAGQQPGTAAH